MRTIVLAVTLGAVGCADVEPAPADSAFAAEGLYVDLATKQLASDAIAVAPRYPLWSDGAVKQRWVRLPAGGTIDTADMDHWRLPVGAKVWKESRISPMLGWFARLTISQASRWSLICLPQASAS